jgi:hypothetical protein
MDEHDITDTEDTQDAPLEWPITIPLERPITAGGKTIDEIVMREPTIGDIDGFQFGIEGIRTADLIRIAARLSGQPIIAIKKLPAGSGGKVLAVARDFYVACLGATS